MRHVLCSTCQHEAYRGPFPNVRENVHIAIAETIRLAVRIRARKALTPERFAEEERHGFPTHYCCSCTALVGYPEEPYITFDAPASNCQCATPIDPHDL
jgi:hypothetical protein